VICLNLNLGRRKDFKWNFIVCNINHPIIGADFLRDHKLVIDLAKGKLIDGLTYINKNFSVVSSVEPTVSSIHRDNPFRDLLEKYAEITKKAIKKLVARKVPQSSYTHSYYTPYLHNCLFRV
jgi:hypothetical protein